MFNFSIVTIVIFLISLVISSFAHFLMYMTQKRKVQIMKEKGGQYVLLSSRSRPIELFGVTRSDARKLKRILNKYNEEVSIK